MLSEILKNYWGYSSFRPLQEEIMSSVLAGKDVLALLPTGGGKSLCFQVPAMAKPGLCLVISPLIALMKDQVEHLRKKGITAFAIFSGMNRTDVINTLKIASHSNCKFLYVSPERLESKLFLEYLPSLEINLLAVDEAHCISQWGYDFRPPYLRIAAIRNELPGVPVLALTASATAKVQQDILEKLESKDPVIFRQSFERPRLSYSLFHSDAKILKAVEILNNVPGTGIVYCKSRKRTKEIAEQLISYGIQADFYHAGLSTEQRNERQEAWIKDRIRVIVCTNAFGMGIDKPDVRTVIHFDLPDSIENYYQEAGRAGRDNKNAFAVLLLQEKDIVLLREQVELRFPSPEIIRKIYGAVMNYLQLPEGTGEGNYYDFDLADFIQKFQFPAHQVIHSLKALEQEDLLTFNEQVFLPSRAVFTCDKETLYDFEKSHPQLEPIIKTLLRSYEGIFDQEVNINEKSIAYLSKSDPPSCIKALHQLHALHIISYKPQKDNPQIYFLCNRVRTAELQINLPLYYERKEAYKKRIEAMIDFTKTTTCRSKLIGNYFGDEKMKSCGVCDNCLKDKMASLTREEFLQIQKQIIQALQENAIHPRDIPQHMNGIRKEKAWKVIEFLQAEKKIKLNHEGKICLNKPGSV